MSNIFKSHTKKDQKQIKHTSYLYTINPKIFVISFHDILLNVILLAATLYIHILQTEILENYTLCKGYNSWILNQCVR